MARNNIKGKEIADALKIRRATFYDKINGHFDFTFSEALKIKRHFFPQHDLEYLFERDDEDDESEHSCLRSS
jgi:plasmid maintenance system antidote protein VapI